MKKSPAEILTELNISYFESGDDLVFSCTSGKHVDSHPSCRMDREEGMFKCFSCGYSGNTYTLYKDLTGEKLHNGDEDYYSNTGYGNSSYKKKEAKKKLRGDIDIVDGVELNVFNNPKIMKFLKSLGINHEETIKELEISYTKFATFKSKFLPELDTKGRPSKPTAFVNRILFPIYDENDVLINIEGRSYTGETPKTLYPKLAISDIIYNIRNCDKNKPLITVEGIKDFVKIYDNVNKNVCSIFGSNWTKNKIQILKDLGFTKIILFIDNDRAGYEMASKFDEMWGYDFEITHSKKEGQDPNDCSVRYIKYLLANTQDYGVWLYNKIKNEMKEEKEYW